MFGPWVKSTSVLGLLLGALLLAASAQPAAGVALPSWFPDPSPSLPAPPWPPLTPQSGAPQLGDFASFIATLQQAIDSLARWVRVFQQASTDVLTRMIWESPGLLPEGADLPDLIAQISMLPDALRSGLEAIRAKLMSPVAPGSVDARHQQQAGSNPAVAHEATGIAAVDEIVAGDNVQQTAASQATALAAAAVSADRRPSVVVEKAQEVGDTLMTTAQNLPSSRAGIEMLTAGVGAGLQQQAQLGAATADRLTVLVQQTAEVSQQIGALAATTGTMTLRQAERDRQALNAQLGLADAISVVAQVLRDGLKGVGETAPGEIQLDPLY